MIQDCLFIILQKIYAMNSRNIYDFLSINIDFIPNIYPFTIAQRKPSASPAQPSAAQCISHDPSLKSFNDQTTALLAFKFCLNSITNLTELKEHDIVVRYVHILRP